jgi:hypothetical protein
MKWPWKSKTQILLEEIEYLRAQVAQLQNFVLVVGPQALAPPPTAPSITPIPEEVQIQMHRSNLMADIDWELSEGLIDKDEWERKMDNVEALNEFN